MLVSALEHDATLMDCSVDGSRVSVSHSRDESSNGTEFYRFSVGKNVRQRLHFTTCSEFTNVDTYMTAYNDMVMSSAKISSNDDDW